MPGFIKALLNGGKLLDGAKNIIDEIVTTKEEKIQLQAKFQELINEHEQSLINAEVDDRKSARQREVDALKAGSKNWTQKCPCLPRGWELLWHHCVYDFSWSWRSEFRIFLHHWKRYRYGSRYCQRCLWILFR